MNRGLNNKNQMGGGRSKYITPSLSILNFKFEDIITKSGCTDCSGDDEPKLTEQLDTSDTSLDNTIDIIQ